MVTTVASTFIFCFERQNKTKSELGSHTGKHIARQAQKADMRTRTIDRSTCIALER